VVVDLGALGVDQVLPWDTMLGSMLVGEAVVLTVLLTFGKSQWQVTRNFESTAQETVGLVNRKDTAVDVSYSENRSTAGR
jgi:hypothetical protein